MAAQSAVKSLDEMVKSDRKKRKAEALAQQIFGKGRQNITSVKHERSSGPGGSLASRMGVIKRSASASSVDRQSRPARGPAPSSLSRATTAARLESHLAQADNRQRPSKSPANGNATKPSTNGGITIRGAAGPYTVVAQNFAPGTTAADIESVMQPIGGDMMGCRLVASNPTVIAEMVFVDKSGAESVIATFNNKKADGRLLHVYLKSVEDAPTRVEEEEVVQGIISTEVAPPAESLPVVPIQSEMDVDMAPSGSDVHGPRSRTADYGGGRGGRGIGRGGRYQGYYEQGRAQPAYQDDRYRYGRDIRDQRWDDRRDYERSNGRLYSDDMNRRGGGGGGGGAGGRRAW